MKKVLVVLCIAAVAFAFTSCKKDSSSGTKSSCKCSGSYKTTDGMEFPIIPISVPGLTGTDCAEYQWQPFIPEGARLTFECVSE